MIIKLDHVAYTCTADRTEAVIRSFQETHRIVFSDEPKNLSIKADFMSSMPKTHGLIMMEPLNAGELPVEITAYEQTFADNNSMAVDGNTVSIFSPDTSETAVFLEAVGFKKTEENEWCMTSIFEPKEVCIRVMLQEGAKLNRLDQDGYCCLAFLCSSAAAERQRLSGMLACTPVRQLEVNGKRLELFYAQGGNGELAELISLERKPR